MRVVWVLLLVPVLLSGCIRDFEEPSSVRLARVDVAAPVVTSGHVVLAANVTFDNTGAASPPLRVVAKAFDLATELLVVTNDTTFPGVPEDSTAFYEVRLEVPRESGYRLEIATLEEGRLQQFGQVTIRNVGTLEPNVRQSDVSVGQIDFRVSNVTGGDAAIRASVYATNDGDAAASPVRMQVKAREVSTGLVADETWSEIRGVGPGETRVFPVNLTVPQGYNYEVQVVLWDGAFVVGRAEGTVQLLPTFTKPKDEELVVTRPDLRDFVREPARGSAGDGAHSDYAPAATPGAGPVLAVAAAGAAAAAFGRRRP